MQEEQSTDGDLVYVRLNLRLLDKISAVDYTEITVEWKNGSRAVQCTTSFARALY